MTKIKEWSFQGSEQLLKSDFPEWIQSIPTLNYSDYFGVWVYSEDSAVIPLIRSRVYLKLPNGKITSVERAAWQALREHLIDKLE